jgi:hypothetical protein
VPGGRSKPALRYQTTTSTVVTAIGVYGGRLPTSLNAAS